MSESDVPDVGFCGAAEAYFVARTDDGEPLRVEMRACRLGRESRLPHGLVRTPDDATFGGRALQVRFRCAGDGRARGYFFARDAANQQGRREEHWWTVAYTDHGGETRESKFRGTLHAYREQENPPNKWTFFGTIRVRMPP